ELSGLRTKDQGHSYALYSNNKRGYSENAGGDRHLQHRRIVCHDSGRISSPKRLFVSKSFIGAGTYGASVAAFFKESKLSGMRVVPGWRRILPLRSGDR